MKISKHCYVLQSLYYIPPWGVNAGFIVGENKTLIIDTGCNYLSAQTIYGYAHNVKPENEIIVINTEKHLDHIGGNSFFQEKGIDIYGHKLINRSDADVDIQKEYFNSTLDNKKRRESKEGYILFESTKIVNPNILIDAEREIELGKVSAKVILTPGHTNTNLSIFIPTDNVLYCGDCIVNKFIPNLEDADKKLWQAWLSSLEQIKSLSPDIVVTGHGEYLVGKTNIDDEISRIGDILYKAIEDNCIPTA